MLKNPISLIVVCISAFSLIGCASVPKVELEQAKANDVKSVAVLPIAESRAVSVFNFGAGMLFGAIGGAIQGAVSDEHSKAYATAINAQNIKMAPPLSDALLDGLKKKGLNVELLTGQRAKLASDGKSDDFTDIKTDADAILVVWFGYTGYYSGATADYKPWVVVHSKLIDARTKKEIYHQSFSAWKEPQQSTIKYVPLKGNVEYKNFDDLMAHFKESVQPLLQGHQAIARELISELKLGRSSLPMAEAR